MDAALSRVAGEVCGSSSGKGARTVFFINNYAVVWATAVERRVHPEDAAPYEAQLKAQVGDCVCVCVFVRVSNLVR